MRVRIGALVALALLLVVVTACADSRISRGPVTTPVPTKTLRPTFTPTPVRPTLTPSPTAEPAMPAAETPAAAAPAAEAPTPEPPTPVPPTPEPTPTPARAAFTVASATLNVRSGPGTNYGIIGQVRQGQTFPITGKNAAGSWWQFDFNGRAGWVSGQLVRATDAAAVEVAANIPAAPTAAPRPTAAPQRPAPTQAPAPAPAASYSFTAAGTEPRPNSNALITVWCRAFNRDRSDFVAGTIRVTRDGATLAEQAFTSVENRADPGLDSEYVYNGGCKIELPDVPGTYAAYLVAGNAQVSETINFVASGETRIFILTWVQK